MEEEVASWKEVKAAGWELAWLEREIGNYQSKEVLGQEVDERKRGREIFSRASALKNGRDEMMRLNACVHHQERG
jgi:hypothetical protein